MAAAAAEVAIDSDDEWPAALEAEDAFAPAKSAVELAEAALAAAKVALGAEVNRVTEAEDVDAGVLSEQPHERQPFTAHGMALQRWETKVRHRFRSWHRTTRLCLRVAHTKNVYSVCVAECLERAGGAAALSGAPCCLVAYHLSGGLATRVQEAFSSTARQPRHSVPYGMPEHVRESVFDYVLGVDGRTRRSNAAMPKLQTESHQVRQLLTLRAVNRTLHAVITVESDMWYFLLHNRFELDSHAMPYEFLLDVHRAGLRSCTRPTTAVRVHKSWVAYWAHSAAETWPLVTLPTKPNERRYETRAGLSMFVHHFRQQYQQGEIRDAQYDIATLETRLQDVAAELFAARLQLYKAQTTATIEPTWSSAMLRRHPAVVPEF